MRESNPLCALWSEFPGIGIVVCRDCRISDLCSISMSHFLFIAGALRERSSQDSAELQLGAGIWGLCTALIRDNLQKFLTPESHGFVYVLKEGICAEFAIASPILPVQALDDFLKDEVRTEARYGFVRITPVRRWQGNAQECQVLLQRVLDIQGAYGTDPAAESGNASSGSCGVPGNSRRVGSWQSDRAL